MSERFNKKFLELAPTLDFPAALVFIATIVTDYFRERDDKMLLSKGLDERLQRMEQQIQEADDKAGRALVTKELNRR